MTEHGVGSTEQLKYPGGKNGMWVGHCSGGDYTSSPQNTEARAVKEVEKHVKDKETK